jgi:predicted ArsR family transcriptional regulator
MRLRNDLDAIGALGDPVRRRLYRLAAESSEPLTRDAAAEALGIPRSTVAFHLGRLVDAGVLEVDSRRPVGRSGPGAGRPAHVYTLTADELIGSLPERHYELAGELLAAAADRADAEGTSMRRALGQVARRTGARVGAESADLESALTACGFEPRDDGTGGLTLENCPFHALAQRYTDIICPANLALVEGMAAGTGDERTPVSEPRPAHCCVAIRGARAAPS